MKLQNIHQREFLETPVSYDIVIAASGYESRAKYVAGMLDEKGVKIANRFALAFTEHLSDCARPGNDKAFTMLGYELLPCSGHSAENAHECFRKALSRLKSDAFARCLIDISSMTRAWYGEIVNTLLTLERGLGLQVDFAYTGAEFVPAKGDYPANRVAGPVPGFVGMTLPDKPTALGIGLGYHVDRAIGLKDYLDPKLTVLCYPNPSFDVRYVDAVRNTNRQIMEEVSASNIIAYPVNDFVSTFNILDSLCEGLMRNSRVVLCSLGPKPFGLCCFLVASIRRDVSIWRVGAGDYEEPIDQKPCGRPMLIETLWSGGG